MQPRPLLFVAAVLSVLAACGEPAAPAATSGDGAKAGPSSSGGGGSTQPSLPDAPIVKEGEACGDGMAGRPKAVCAAGLVCELTVAAPGGPPNPAAPGKCRQKL